jgi:hypothetical protein
MTVALIIVIILLVMSAISQAIGRGEAVLLTLWAIAIILLCNVHL